MHVYSIRAEQRLKKHHRGCNEIRPTEQNLNVIVSKETVRKFVDYKRNASPLVWILVVLILLWLSSLLLLTRSSS